jgi:hypothetical protein
MTSAEGPSPVEFRSPKRNVCAKTESADLIRLFALGMLADPACDFRCTRVSSTLAPHAPLSLRKPTRRPKDGNSGLGHAEWS